MGKARWGSDVAYVFSVHRSFLWIFGSWPLQNNSIFSHIRWTLTTLLEISLTVPAVMDIFVTHITHGATLENVLFLECGILALAKNLLPRIHLNKLARNIECAMFDWSIVLREESSYRTMKKYARTGRLVTLIMLNCACCCFCLYYASIVFYPRGELNRSIRNVTMKRRFLISFNWLTDDMSNELYLAVILLQIGQTFVVGIRQSVVDSFFFSLVMHLCGQLEVLSIKLRNFGRYRETDKNHKEELVSMVKRHRELIELVNNIEDTFNIIILLQILMSMILIALSGFRLITFLVARDNIQVLQSILAIIFFILQCSIYTHAGDMLQTCGEQFFFNIYDAPWYEFTSATSKDLQFMMMRANVPLRITGGKFVNISCKTMMNILKSAASYISVLRVTMKD